MIWLPFQTNRRPKYDEYEHTQPRVIAQRMSSVHPINIRGPPHHTMSSSTPSTLSIAPADSGDNAFNPKIEALFLIRFDKKVGYMRLPPQHLDHMR
jgi:hypothetical protein